MIAAQQIWPTNYQEMDQRVKLVALIDPVCILLMTASGVGAVTALHFKAAIDDPWRFTLSRLDGASTLAVNLDQMWIDGTQFQQKDQKELV